MSFSSNFTGCLTSLVGQSRQNSKERLQRKGSRKREYWHFRCHYCGDKFEHEAELSVHWHTEHRQYLDDRTIGKLIEEPREAQAPVASTQEIDRFAQSNPQERHSIAKMLSDTNREESINHMIPPHMSKFDKCVSRAVCSEDLVHFESTRCGVFRGIQGENNSCYMDASIMAMFYANGTFDKCLSSRLRTESRKKINTKWVKSHSHSHSKSLKSNHHRRLSEDLKYAQKFFTFQIVNNIRGRGFVPSVLIVEFRRMIDDEFGGGIDFSHHCDRKEASEFVFFFLETFGIEENFSCTMKKTPRTASDGEKLKGETITTFLIQTLPPPNGRNTVFSSKELLDHFLRSEEMKFQEVGASLILQTPRYGSGDRLVGGVFPCPTLSVQISSARKGVVNFELRAVIVIDAGHFATYLRVPARMNDKEESDYEFPRESIDGSVRWLFSDSMADRQFGQNVPVLEEVTDELQVLESPDAIYFVREEAGLNVQQDTGGWPDQRGWERTSSRRPHLRRITQDACLLFYSVIPELPHSYGNKHR